MTWEQINVLTPVDYSVYSKEKGRDIINLQNFKLYYILIEEATDDEMVQIFSRLNSNEPLSDGEWLNCLIPALPLWGITKKIADYCFSNNCYKQIYNFLNNKTIHQDFDPMRNMDAWFWANITIILYLYEKNKKLVFLDGKKKDLKEAYENLNEKYNSLTEEEKKFDEKTCEAIYSNMLEAMPFFLGICNNMNNDSKRPKNLFIAYIYSYMQRNNENLLLKIKTNNSVESNKIKVFFGMNIPKKDNEHTIEYANSLKRSYDEVNKNNSPSSRRKRYEVFSELMR